MTDTPTDMLVASLRNMEYPDAHLAADRIEQLTDEVLIRKMQRDENESAWQAEKEIARRARAALREIHALVKDVNTRRSQRSVKIRQIAERELGEQA